MQTSPATYRPTPQSGRRLVPTEDRGNQGGCGRVEQISDQPCLPVSEAASRTGGVSGVRTDRPDQADSIDSAAQASRGGSPPQRVSIRGHRPREWGVGSEVDLAREPPPVERPPRGGQAGSRPRTRSGGCASRTARRATERRSIGLAYRRTDRGQRCGAAGSRTVLPTHIRSRSASKDDCWSGRSGPGKQTGIPDRGIGPSDVRWEQRDRMKRKEPRGSWLWVHEGTSDGVFWDELTRTLCRRNPSRESPASRGTRPAPPRKSHRRGPDTVSRLRHTGPLRPGRPW